MGGITGVGLKISDSEGVSNSSALVNDLTGRENLEDLLYFLKNGLIRISLEVLKEEQSRGFDPKPKIFVDNRHSKPIGQVHPLGKIEFVSRENIVDIILFAYDLIAMKSKVVSGEYKENNVITFNGIIIPSDNRRNVKEFFEGRAMKASDKVRFINISPYARKLERMGVTAQRTSLRQESNKRATAKKRGRTFGRMAVKLPNGVYHLSGRALKRAYGKNAGIKFEFLWGGSMGVQGDDSSKKTGQKYRRTFKKDGRPYLYPSITITVQDYGVH